MFKNSRQKTLKAIKEKQCITYNGTIQMTLDLSSEPQRPKKWHSIFLNTRKKQNCLQGILYPVKLLFKNVLLT